MAYHASGKPILRTGSIVAVPPKVRAHLPYGNAVTVTPYLREDRNGWNARLLKDVESRYSAKRAAREARKQPSRGKVTVSRVEATHRDRAAVERALVGTIRMADMD